MKSAPAILCLLVSLSSRWSASQEQPTLRDEPEPEVIPASRSVPSAASARAVERSDHPQIATSRPFRALAVSAKLGSGGIGFDFITPLAGKLDLRAGAQFFDYTTLISTSGVQSDTDITLRTIALSVDVYPFHNSFHVSPGVTLNNGNHVTANLAVPPGQTFTLGDAEYLSDLAHPVQGIARLKFGSVIAPRLTFGFGALPRKRGRLSFPVELGLQYTSPPSVDLVFIGSACDQDGNCGALNTRQGNPDLQNEVKKLTDDLAPLRFFPIVSVGVSYRLTR